MSHLSFDPITQANLRILSLNKERQQLLDRIAKINIEINAMTNVIIHHQRSSHINVNVGQSVQSKSKKRKFNQVESDDDEDHITVIYQQPTCAKDIYRQEMREKKQREENANPPHVTIDLNALPDEEEF